jgi:REP element-mobilizing transposase RayT
MQNKGMELYGWCTMTSHIHMIIGSHADRLERIMQNMKRHTSEKLHEAIIHNPAESRREWMLWMMEWAGKKNSNNINFPCLAADRDCGSNAIIQ